MTEFADFDYVLGVCMDRLRNGDTVEACLSSYPAHAIRLAPLLRVAAMMQLPAPPAISADGFRAGEARVLARAAELGSRQRPVSPRRHGAGSGLLGNLRRLIAVTTAALLLLCAVLSAGALSASAASLPGSPLYPVKRASESLVSSVALTSQLQTRVHLAWADRRLREIEALVARDGVADDALLTALEQETGYALSAAEQAGSGSLTSAVVHTEYQHTVLSNLLAAAPKAARPGLERALAASAQSRANARSALEKVKSPGRTATPPGHASPGPPIVPPGQVKTRPVGKKTPILQPDDARPPDQVDRPQDPGPPDHANPSDGASSPHDPGPPDHAGPPDAPGPPDHANPSDGAGPPDDKGPPDHAGAPDDPGPPDHTGAPDDKGPPDDKGGGNGNDKGGGKGK